jgi:hypothetical protein
MRQLSLDHNDQVNFCKQIYHCPLICSSGELLLVLHILLCFFVIYVMLVNS